MRLRPPTKENNNNSQVNEIKIIKRRTHTWSSLSAYRHSIYVTKTARNSWNFTIYT